MLCKLNLILIAVYEDGVLNASSWFSKPLAAFVAPNFSVFAVSSLLAMYSAGNGLNPTASKSFPMLKRAPLIRLPVEDSGVLLYL